MAPVIPTRSPAVTPARLAWAALMIAAASGTYWAQHQPARTADRCITPRAGETTVPRTQPLTQPWAQPLAQAQLFAAARFSTAA